MNGFRFSMTAEDVANLCEMSDEEFSDTFEDDNDEEYVPPANDKESDVEDVRTGERVPIETEVEINSDDDEEFITETDNIAEPPPSDDYHCRDSTIWNKNPLPPSQTRSYNIIRESGKELPFLFLVILQPRV